MNFCAGTLRLHIDEYFIMSSGQGNEKLEYNGGFRAHLHMCFGIKNVE